MRLFELSKRRDILHCICTASRFFRLTDGQALVEHSSRVCLVFRGGRGGRGGGHWVCTSSSSRAGRGRSESAGATRLTQLSCVCSSPRGCDVHRLGDRPAVRGRLDRWLDRRPALRRDRRSAVLPPVARGQHVRLTLRRRWGSRLDCGCRSGGAGNDGLRWTGGNRLGRCGCVCV